MAHCYVLSLKAETELRNFPFFGNFWVENPGDVVDCLVMFRNLWRNTPWVRSEFLVSFFVGTWMITSFDPHDESFDGDVFVAWWSCLVRFISSYVLGDPFFSGWTARIFIFLERLEGFFLRNHNEHPNTVDSNSFVENPILSHRKAEGWASGKVPALGAELILEGIGVRKPHLFDTAAFFLWGQKKNRSDSPGNFARENVNIFWAVLEYHSAGVLKKYVCYFSIFSTCFLLCFSFQKNMNFPNFGPWRVSLAKYLSKKWSWVDRWFSGWNLPGGTSWGW